MMESIPCFWMRGGTSKAGCFMESDLPESVTEQNDILCRIYGSDDPSGRQINGMGGGTSTTSKAMIVGKRPGEKNAVNYTFCQVETSANAVDRKGNCGNISSAVGPFAIENGLVDEITEPMTEVTIFNTNTQKTIVSHVPVKNGKVVYDGNFAISGVPGTGARIQLDFLSPGGAVTGKLLPTGNTKDVIDVPGYGDVEISVVDAGNPLVFVRAKDLGLTGQELPAQIDSDPELLRRMLAIREATAVLIGLAKDMDDARHNSQAVPKFCFIAPPAEYTNLQGQQVPVQQIDILARMLSMGKLHPVLAITGGICIGVAAKIPGTLVYEITERCADKDELNIGHCSGVLSVSANVENNHGEIQALNGTVYRTARVLMKGNVELS
ncbi:2-methylaconitate cis-trans isomerase PrpF family protein [Pragia fontium]|uniref:Methylaconitate Delta-isomerase PrpF n=1 Tax=Pragia fontium TaxID=82985 RepID=A0ABQ5LKC5_9GAMM|nr:PrpF domain-containing protein [Pragia fontium]GKX64071.1 putative methylaconitate Delta-isomerase PrpF [Pragia fontium]VEJ56616.1 3-methylitaconate isomerase [Pragia fontium]